MNCFQIHKDGRHQVDDCRGNVQKGSQTEEGRRSPPEGMGQQAGTLAAGQRCHTLAQFWLNMCC